MDRAAAPPTVALLTFNYPDSTGWFANALAGAADVQLLVADDLHEYVAEDLDPRVTLSPFARARRTEPLAQRRMCRELVRRLRELDPDVIHIQQGHYTFNFALGRLRGKPLVVTAHDVEDHRRERIDLHRVPQWPYTRGLRRAERVVVHTEALRPALARQGVDLDRIHLLPRAGPRLTGPASPSAGPTVLFFGRIWPYKGLEYLIAAEPAITRQVPEVKIVIAGQGEDLARYRRLMRHPDRFEVHDRFVSRRERDELFSRASVVVLPYASVSSSAVIPLAYAHGRPVVVTAVGGLGGDVEDGRTGLVVAPRDPAALAAALIRILTDDRARRAFGDAGRRKLEVENDPALVAGRALEVYRLATERRC